MIRQEHFPCEKHTVETEDGYVLTIHRIPQQNSTQNNHKIILLMHGAYGVNRLNHDLSIENLVILNDWCFNFKVFRTVQRHFWTTGIKSQRLLNWIMPALMFGWSMQEEMSFLGIILIWRSMIRASGNLGKNLEENQISFKKFKNHSEKSVSSLFLSF